MTKLIYKYQKRITKVKCCICNKEHKIEDSIQNISPWDEKFYCSEICFDKA